VASLDSCSFSNLGLKSKIIFFGAIIRAMVSIYKPGLHPYLCCTLVELLIVRFLCLFCAQFRA
jgi:hypothetical protein